MTFTLTPFFRSPCQSVYSRLRINVDTCSETIVLLCMATWPGFVNQDVIG